MSDTRGHWPSEKARASYTDGVVPTIADDGVNDGKDADGDEVTNGQLFADPADPTIPRANVAVFKVSAASQTAAEPYQVRYTYTGSDHDGDRAGDNTDR